MDDHKSTSRNYFSFGSCLITYSLKKKKLGAPSSTEEEYVVVTSTGTQALWLRNVLEEIREKKF